MDEEKEKFFLAVMFDIGPPPVDNTRQGTLVGSKGAPHPVRAAQKEIFKNRMVYLMGVLRIEPFEFGLSAEDLFYDYVKWHDTQHALKRASAMV